MKKDETKMAEQLAVASSLRRRLLDFEELAPQKLGLRNAPEDAPLDTLSLLAHWCLGFCHVHWSIHFWICIVWGTWTSKWTDSMLS